MSNEQTTVDRDRLRAHRQEWTAIANEDLKDAKHVQRWTVFYLIAAAIALLGVAFETAPLGQHPILDLAELIAWIGLATSAGAGLLYVRKLPDVYLKGVRETTARGQAQAGEMHKAMGDETLSIGGETVPVQDYIERNAEQAQATTAAMKAVVDTMARIGKWQFRSFVTGLVLLAVVRAVPTAAETIGELALCLGQ